MTSKATEPQPCYHGEIETLREMLNDEREGLADRLKKPAWITRKASVQGAIRQCQRRIEALETAIEALGGAL